MSPDEIIQEHITNGTGTNSLSAAIGKLTSDRTQELSQSIKGLQEQIPNTISDLRSTISRNTDKMIESNTKLSKSNENYTKWIKWLTLALVIVGLIQTITIIFK